MVEMQSSSWPAQLV